jgi:hypothetical protein
MPLGETVYDELGGRPAFSEAVQEKFFSSTDAHTNSSKRISMHLFPVMTTEREEWSFWVLHALLFNLDVWKLVSFAIDCHVLDGTL